MSPPNKGDKHRLMELLLKLSPPKSNKVLENDPDKKGSKNIAMI